jgi:transcriptional regulator with XRE-family HTH domain
MYVPIKATDLAARLKALRIERDVTQSVVALNIGLSRGGYNRLECANVFPSLDTLIQLANYFDVSTDYLLGRCDDKWPSNLPGIFDRE